MQGWEYNVEPRKFYKKNKHRALNQYLHNAQKSTFPLFNKAIGPGKNPTFILESRVADNVSSTGRISSKIQSLCPSNKVFPDSTSDTYYCYGRNTIVVLMRNKRCALTCKSQLPIEPNRKRCDMSECLENEFANKQLSIYYRYATQAIFQKISEANAMAFTKYCTCSIRTMGSA